MMAAYEADFRPPAALRIGRPDGVNAAMVATTIFKSIPRGLPHYRATSSAVNHPV